MSDIVERLRAPLEGNASRLKEYQNLVIDQDDVREAADEITRLRTALEDIRLANNISEAKALARIAIEAGRRGR